MATVNIETLDIAKWIRYDNKIKEYNDKLKKLREERDNAGRKIINHFNTENETATINITNLNTSLSIQNNKVYENYTNKFYKDCFEEFLGSEEKAKELIDFMKQKRKVQNKISIRRSYIMDI